MKGKQWLSMALACCMAVGSQTVVFAQENEETVELTALISKHSLTKDVNEMEWLTELEAQNGVSVEWQQITADWNQKKSVMFAGGDIPDILFKATATSDFATYNGLFEDLAPYIDNGQMPNVAKCLRIIQNLEHSVRMRTEQFMAFRITEVYGRLQTESCILTRHG